MRDLNSTFLGKTSVVQCFKHERTSTLHALKQYTKGVPGGPYDRSILNEILTLRKLQKHPNIIR